METQQTNITPPRTGTKQIKLVTMLSRKSGVTITKASEALEWQLHTTRSALTGLRKRGYQIKRKDRKGKASVYLISDEGK